MDNIVSQLYDYILLVLSLIVVIFEAIATTITLLIPSRVIESISSLLRRLLPRSYEQQTVENDPELKARVSAVADALSFEDICAVHGYLSTEHLVATPDGYMLGIHRLRPETECPKGVVYLHHGLLMNSEIWVAAPTPQDSIAFQLVDAGYEVWLGNNRGNKYSRKHLNKNPNSRDFWNFCIDEFALYDIPTAVDYILRVCNVESLVYVGFSQGSAQGFAALSVHPALNKKISMFVALGPTLAPPSFGPRILQSLIGASPTFLYHLFGHRVILRSVVFWQNIMLPELFLKMIDLSNAVLFKWRSKDISWAQKMTGFMHLYSYTSVKCVVHWFQIIARGKGIHMYDDTGFGPFGLSGSSSNAKFYQVPHYPIRNITCPIELVYGTADNLVNVKYLEKNLPPGIGTFRVDGYEHLEMIWGRKVRSVIGPHILSLLKRHQTQRLIEYPLVDNEVDFVQKFEFEKEKVDQEGTLVERQLKRQLERQLEREFEAEIGAKIDSNQFQQELEQEIVDELQTAVELELEREIKEIGSLKESKKKHIDV